MFSTPNGAYVRRDPESSLERYFDRFQSRHHEYYCQFLSEGSYLFSCLAENENRRIQTYLFELKEAQKRLNEDVILQTWASSSPPFPDFDGFSQQTVGNALWNPGSEITITDCESLNLYID